MIDVIAELRRRVEGEIFDYQILMDVLQCYGKPRDQVTRLLSKNVIIRIKKGLYCFGKPYRRKSISEEYVANLIYGPSYISLEYALQFYGLIPERVHTVTSVSLKRSKTFRTPVGNFSYRMLSGNRYATGFTLHSATGYSFLIASPEKALADKVWSDKRFPGSAVSDFHIYLEEDLRIDRQSLSRLSRADMKTICNAFDSRKIWNLASYLERIWKDSDA
ncbi:MAG: hypothetical protein KAS73_07105 [Candidatus Sabulitectum sp.]|nr:hypothetical protein [Candidatus Sabulitectum sp.]